MFSETLNVDYVSAAWREFEMSLGPLARDAVESVCDRLTTDKGSSINDIHSILSIFDPFPLHVLKIYCTG